MWRFRSRLLRGRCIASRVLRGWRDGEAPDPERIHQIDDGDYQGTLVFVIGAQGYQPSTYWATSVGYGSCSGCDALEDAWGYGDQHDYEGLYSLTLHMLQGAERILGV